MTRDDVPGVLLAVVIGAGLVWNLLGPGFLGGAIVLSTAHPAVAVCAWAACAATLVVGVPTWWWGPIRVSTARARWGLSGPADRGPALRRALVDAAGITVVAGTLSGLLVGALARQGVGAGGVGLACAAGAVTALVVVATALVAQIGRSHRMRAACGSIARLHHDVVAPDDGLAGSVRLMLLTGDTAFVEQARRIRWCRRHIRSRTGSLVATPPVAAMIRADLIRLTRRRGDLLAWLTVAVVTVALGVTTVMPTVGPAVACLLGYRAGSAVAAGLRTIATTPGLGRALGVPSPAITLAHSVIPAVAVVAWLVVAVVAWPATALASWAVILVGTVTAVLRRASRPEPPWDAPAYVTGQGGVVQPLLVAALVRGHLTMAVTAVLACLVA